MKRIIKASEGSVSNRLRKQLEQITEQAFANQGCEIAIQDPYFDYGGASVCIPAVITSWKGNPVRNDAVLYKGYSMSIPKFSFMNAPNYFMQSTRYDAASTVSEYTKDVERAAKHFVDVLDASYASCIDFIDSQLPEILSDANAVCEKLQNKYSVNADASVIADHGANFKLYGAGIGAGFDSELKYVIKRGQDTIAQLSTMVKYPPSNAYKSLSRQIEKAIGNQPALSSKSLVSKLNAKGIDTTNCRYVLKAEEYERYEAGRVYTKTFTCPGDWLAYFSMLLHTKPTYAKLIEYFGEEEIEDMVDQYSLQDMKNLASQSWYGDGDDYIILLQNLTTGETLYQGDYEVSDEEEIDEEF